MFVADAEALAITAYKEVDNLMRAGQSSHQVAAASRNLAILVGYGRSSSWAPECVTVRCSPQFLHELCAIASMPS